MNLSQESTLLKMLQEAVEATQQLIEVLQQEQDALVQHDIDALEDCVQTKSLALTRLQMVEASLSQSFSAMGFDLDKSLLEQLEQLAHENIELKSCARYMKDSLQECQRLTKENASLVSTGLKRVSDSLNFMHNLHNKEVASVYGPPGHLAVEKMKRSITVV